MERHDGALPTDFDALLALPGIGRSTAGAILAQAHKQRFAILDGNVKRVLTRYHGIRGYPGTGAVEKRLWRHAEAHTPHERVDDYTQAIMDLGATVCTRADPHCARCPLATACVARRDNLTATLPERRPAKKLPTRDTFMVLLQDAQHLFLLQKRGAQVVWAGLWSLPEAGDTQSATSEAERHARVGKPKPLPSFTHTFGHYRLDVTPLLFATATPIPSIADNDDIRWCSRDDMETLGLPAPVRTLLEKL